MQSILHQEAKAASMNSESLPFPSLFPRSTWRTLHNRFELTAREAQITEYIASGCPSDWMSQRLGIRPDTLRKHIRAIYRKTGCRSRTELVLTLVHAGRGLARG